MIIALVNIHLCVPVFSQCLFLILHFSPTGHIRVGDFHFPLSTYHVRVCLVALHALDGPSTADELAAKCQLQH